MSKNFDMNNVNNALINTMEHYALKKKEKNFTKTKKLFESFQNKNPILKEYGSENFIEQLTTTNANNKKSGWGTNKIKR